MAAREKLTTKKHSFLRSKLNCISRDVDPCVGLLDPHIKTVTSSFLFQLTEDCVVFVFIRQNACVIRRQLRFVSNKKKCVDIVQTIWGPFYCSVLVSR